jgi:hypothetical protein
MKLIKVSATSKMVAPAHLLPICKIAIVDISRCIILGVVGPRATALLPGSPDKVISYAIPVALTFLAEQFPNMTFSVRHATSTAPRGHPCGSPSVQLPEKSRLDVLHRKS